MIMTYEMEKKTTRLKHVVLWHVVSTNYGCGESKNNISGRFKRGGGGEVDMVESP